MQAVDIHERENHNKEILVDKITSVCPICKSKDTSEAVKKSFEGYVSSWDKCSRCETVYMFPMPQQDELTRYYESNYIHKKSPGYVSHAYRFNEQNKNTISNEYLLTLQDLDIQPSTLKGHKILDFGCANGFFLDFLESVGCNKADLYGYDIAKDMINTVKQKGYNILSREKHFFDYIFLWDVLEHISTPEEQINIIKDLMTFTGKIVIQTPRSGFFSERLGIDWEYFLPLEHVILYSRFSLELFLSSMGFSTIKIASFGSNAPIEKVQQPYKSAFDMLVKLTDTGTTQIGCFMLQNAESVG